LFNLAGAQILQINTEHKTHNSSWWSYQKRWSRLQLQNILSWLAASIYVEREREQNMPNVINIYQKVKTFARPSHFLVTGLP